MSSIAIEDDEGSVVPHLRSGSVGLVLLSMLVLATAAVGAAFVGYAIYTIAARGPDVAYGAAQGVRPIVTLQWPRAVGFLLPVAFLTAVVAIGGLSTFVHRATFAHGQGQRQVPAPSVLAAQSALFLVIVAPRRLGRRRRDNRVTAGRRYRPAGRHRQRGSLAASVRLGPSFPIAIATGCFLRKASLRPSLRRVSVFAVVACALGGGAAVAQLGATSQGQPLLEAGFYRVSFAGVASVQFMEVTCTNGDDCVASGYGTFGSKLPNGRALLATSTDGGAAWRVVALPALYSSPSPPACDGGACLVAFGTAPSRGPYQVMRGLSRPGAVSLSSLGTWPLSCRRVSHVRRRRLPVRGGSPGGTPKDRSTAPVVWQERPHGAVAGSRWSSRPRPARQHREGVQGPWCTGGFRCAAAVVLTRAGCTLAALSGP